MRNTLLRKKEKDRQNMKLKTLYFKNLLQFVERNNIAQNPYETV